jgi:hypothetical protein
LKIKGDHLADNELFVKEKSRLQLNQLVYDAVDYQKGKRRYVSPPPGLDGLIQEKSRAILRCLTKDQFEAKGSRALKKGEELASSSFTSKDMKESSCN